MSKKIFIALCLITATLAAMKLTGVAISWVLVFAPLWIPGGAFMIILLVVMMAS